MGAVDQKMQMQVSIHEPSRNPTVKSHFWSGNKKIYNQQALRHTETMAQIMHTARRTDRSFPKDHCVENRERIKIVASVEKLAKAD